MLNLYLGGGDKIKNCNDYYTNILHRFEITMALRCLCIMIMVVLLMVSISPMVIAELPSHIEDSEKHSVSPSEQFGDSLLILDSAKIDRKPLGFSKSSIDISPSLLQINGSLGKDTFQGQFNLTAVQSNISNLTFRPSNMQMDIAGGPLAPNIIIPSVDIQVSGEKKIIMGQTEQYLLSVNNIPGSGKYTGELYINYEKQPAGKHVLPISLLAYKLNSSSSSILVSFENGVLSYFGTEDLNYELKLNKEYGFISPEVAKGMIVGLNIKLSELTNSDRSSIINSVDIFKLIDKKYGDNGSILIQLNFKNGQFAPGKYTGNLIVGLNGSLQPLVIVPVELRVRSNKWLAFFLILIGVFGYLILNNWNTTGKERNDIERHVLKISTRMRKSSIPVQCCSKIEGILSNVQEFIHDKNLVDARKKVIEAESELKTCEDAKKKLDEKEESTKLLIIKLDKLRAQTILILKNYGQVKPSESEVITFISNKLLGDLNSLRNKIYKASSVDEKKWDNAMGGEKSVIDLFNECDTNINDYKKLIADFQDLKTDLESDQIPDNLKIKLNTCIGDSDAKEFRDINIINDVKTLSEKLQKRKNQLNDKNKLNTCINEYNKLISELNEDEKKALEIESDYIIRALCSDYATSEDINKKIENIKKIRSQKRETPPSQKNSTIEAKWASSEKNFALLEYINKADHLNKSKKEDKSPNDDIRGSSSPEVFPAEPLKIGSIKADKGTLDFVSTIESKMIEFWRLETKEGEKVKWTAEASPVLKDERILFRFILNGKERRGWKADNIWIWTPTRMDDLDNRLKVEAKYDGIGGEEVIKILNIRWLRSEKNSWDKIKDEIYLPEFLSPEWKEAVMKTAIWIAVIGSLSFIGYVQLYSGNPTFGSGNTLLEYSTLIFWGFGIQAGTSKALDIVKALGGS